MKIGLALGSGAARGWAHIGIIQALEELGIKIDVVAGCSIGAYVGAAYASNKLAPMAEWACSLTEWQVLSLLGVGIRRGGLASGNKVFQALEDNFCEADFSQLSKPFAAVATDLYSGKEVSFFSGPVGAAVRASCAIPALFPPVSFEGRWLVDGAVVNPVPVNLCRHLGADFVFAVNLSADFRPEIQESFVHEQQQNQEKTNAFFRKSQTFMQQLFRSKGKRDTANLEQIESEQFLVELSDEPDQYDAEMSQLTEQNSELSVIDQTAESQASPTKAILKRSSQRPPTMLGVMSSSLDIMQARVTRSRLAGDPPDVLIEPHLRDFGIMEFHRAKELSQEGRESVQRIADQIKYQLRI